MFDKNGILKTKFDLDEKLNELGNEGWELVYLAGRCQLNCSQHLNARESNFIFENRVQLTAQ